MEKENIDIRFKELSNYRQLDSENNQHSFEALINLSSKVLNCNSIFISVLHLDEHKLIANKGVTSQDWPYLKKFCDATINVELGFFLNQNIENHETNINSFLGYPLLTENGFRIGVFGAYSTAHIVFNNIIIEEFKLLGKLAEQLLKKHKIKLDLSLYKDYVLELFKSNDNPQFGGWNYNLKNKRLELPEFILNSLASSGHSLNQFDTIYDFESVFPQIKTHINNVLTKGIFKFTIDNVELQNIERLNFVLFGKENNLLQGIVHSCQNYLFSRYPNKELNPFSVLEIFNNIDACVTLINQSGTIVWTNNSWNKFAEDNGADLSKTGLGVNYLQICEMTSGDGELEAKITADAIKKILLDKESSFQQKYPCHSNKEKRYFLSILKGVEFNDKKFVLIIHENITETVILTEKEKHSRIISEQKDTIIQEIHHRVKNNLQIVKSLLSLQKNRINDENTKSILDASSRRIHAISLLHEKLYSKDHLNEINLNEYISDLVNMLLLETKIKSNLNLENIYVGSGLANPLGLIISELTANSLKYGFDNTNNPKIEIELFHDSSKIHLHYADNGKGFDVNQTIMGLGMELIDSLNDQLGAEYIIKTELHKGFSYSMHFELELNKR